MLIGVIISVILDIIIPHWVVVNIITGVLHCNYDVTTASANKDTDTTSLRMVLIVKRVKLKLTINLSYFQLRGSFIRPQVTDFPRKRPGVEERRSIFSDIEDIELKPIANCLHVNNVNYGPCNVQYC